MNLLPNFSVGTAAPTFICVGAEKSGTTQLYDCLSAHPDIFMSPIKETHFFSTDVRVENFRGDYAKHESQKHFDIQEYFSSVPLAEIWEAYLSNPEHYLRLFTDGSEHAARGEVCNSYLYSAEAVSNINDSLPDVKVLVILRNPIHRAFSQYRAMVRDGRTEKDNLIDEVHFDMQFADRRWGSCHGYIEHGLYSSQLQRLYSVFSPARVQIVLAEDFFASRQQVFDGICEHIGVAHFALDSNIDNRNRSLVPRNAGLIKLVSRTGVKGRLASLLPAKGKKWLKELFFESDKAELLTEEYEFLHKFFVADVERTSTILQRDLSGWLKY
ncbi:MAG: sulfotransferase [Gammaproteobacteria bacterium]